MRKSKRLSPKELEVGGVTMFNVTAIAWLPEKHTCTEQYEMYVDVSHQRCSSWFQRAIKKRRRSR